MRCPKCATNNGITCYGGKVCKRCGYELIPKQKDVNYTEGEKDGK